MYRLPAFLLAIFIFSAVINGSIYDKNILKTGYIRFSTGLIIQWNRRIVDKIELFGESISDDGYKLIFYNSIEFNHLWLTTLPELYMYSNRQLLPQNKIPGIINLNNRIIQIIFPVETTVNISAYEWFFICIGN